MTDLKDYELIDLRDHALIDLRDHELIDLRDYVQFRSAQLKMVSMRSEKPICAPPRLLDVSPMSPLKQFV